jgi:predicted component of type VI protein secretion system
MTTAARVQPQTAIWTCRDGRKVRVCDMSDRHLLNTIAMLERNAAQELSEGISAAYSVAASLQGEMASFYADQDINRMEQMSPGDLLRQTVPIYEKLLADKERRGL